MFSRIQKRELEQLDSTYLHRLTDCIERAKQLGQMTRAGEITPEENEELMTDLRTKARIRKKANENHASQKV